MKKGDLILLLWRIPLDFLVVVGCWFVAYSIRPYTDLIPWIQRAFPMENLPLMSFFLPFALWSAIGFIVLMGLLGRYRFEDQFEPVREFFRLLLAVFLWGMLIVAWYAFYRHELIFSRIVLFHTMAMTIVSIFCVRLILRHIQQYLWRRGKNRKQIVLFGSPKSTAQMEHALKSYPQFQIMGSFSDQEISHLETCTAEELWKCDQANDENIAQKLQHICSQNHWLFRYVPQQETNSFARLELSLIGDTPVVLSLPAAPTAGQMVGKRVFDIIFSATSLIILSPFFLIFAVCIRLDSRGNIFFQSTRIGRHGSPFQMWKFRSMVANAEYLKKDLHDQSHRDGPLFKVKDDPRITRFGKFLRRFSLDELPNLINVLRGDMSLIGPRPHLPEEVQQYQQWQKRILMMKPGASGLAQVSGRSDLSFAEEMRLDLYYLENWSFWLDLKIIWKTIAVVLSQKGAD